MRKLILMPMLILQGCGLIVNSATQTIGFSSNPSGARVTVTSNSEAIGWNQTQGTKESCITPCAIELSRKIDYYLISAELDGYAKAGQSITRRSSGALWGNIFFPIGVLVDLSSGGGYKLSPESLNFELRKQ